MKSDREVLDALHAANGRISEAAKSLGIQERGLLYRVATLRIRHPEKLPPSLIQPACDQSRAELIRELQEAYHRDPGNVALRNKLVAHHLPELEAFLRRASRRISASVGKDAVRSELQLRLIRAVEQWRLDDPSGMDFPRFLWWQFMYGLLDACETGSATMRKTRASQTASASALAQELGRCPSTEEIEARWRDEGLRDTPVLGEVRYVPQCRNVDQKPITPSQTPDVQLFDAFEELPFLERVVLHLNVMMGHAIVKLAADFGVSREVLDTAKSTALTKLRRYRDRCPPPDGAPLPCLTPTRPRKLPRMQCDPRTESGVAVEAASGRKTHATALECSR